LESLVLARPTSDDALRRIKGIGAKTAETYGPELLDLLA